VVSHFKTIEQKTSDIKEWLGTGSINIFGRQFAGKDIHATTLAARIGSKVIGGGDILRNQVLPPHILTTLNQGGLIPSDEYEQIVLPYLSHESLRNRSLILSSLGRIASEQTAVINACIGAHHEIKVVPILHITEEEAFRRLAIAPSRGRIQDNARAMRLRMDQYLEYTGHVIKTYHTMGLAIDVDAMQPKDIVHTSLIEGIHDYALSH
jgi:adenylate kinase family enzyme